MSTAIGAPAPRGPRGVTCMHAKCVSVDGKRALVSRANFTDRGHDRNIETGVLLHDKRFSDYLERQWLSLISEELVLKWDGS